MLMTDPFSGNFDIIVLDHKSVQNVCISVICGQMDPMQVFFCHRFRKFKIRSITIVIVYDLEL